MAASIASEPRAGAQPSAGGPTDNAYAVDLYQGPILAPIRVTALSGAYAGYAEGIAGFVTNAASPAVRSAHSVNWLELDLDASLSIPVSLFDNNDFDNSGDLDADYSSFIYLAAGAQLQAGAVGAGIFADQQRYELQAGTERAAVTVGRYHGLLGWQLLGDQLVVGGGIRAATLGVSTGEVELTNVGAAPQFGILIRPDWMPFRVGATYRHAVRAAWSVGSGVTVDPGGVERAGPLAVPASAELPWEIETGIAVQVGPRPLNPAWIDPRDHEQRLIDVYERRRLQREIRQRRQLDRIADPGARERLARQQALGEERVARAEHRKLARELALLSDERRARARNWPREHLLLTADVLVTGPVSDAISLERFLAQGQPQVGVGSDCRAVSSGEQVNFSPRVGLEMEPVPQYVHTRFGTYYEPNRFRYEPASCDDRVGRQHFTFGADVKLVRTTWFGLVPEVTYKLQGYGDLAPRYQAFGLGLGVWY
ncbi:MAG: hypothetical protein JRI23_10915 [Deltaproteobacteria bacterium]|nr:hypothetical protein [Deltaproteobacteria bacterium]MBW2532192.1 hypothetical protein [Deltaproteobacteria bacterium]